MPTLCLYLLSPPADYGDPVSVPAADPVSIVEILTSTGLSISSSKFRQTVMPPPSAVILVSGISTATSTPECVRKRGS